MLLGQYRKLSITFLKEKIVLKGEKRNYFGHLLHIVLKLVLDSDKY